MVGGGPGGNIGVAHRKALTLCGINIAAGSFSRDYQKNKEMAEKLGINAERCYKDYSEMALKESERTDGIDFVVVVTPNNSHYDICKKFLDCGINVVCDKPLALKYSDAKELEKTAKKNGLLFMVTYTYTGHHMFRKLKNMIATGKLGTVRKIMAEYPQSWLADEKNDGGKQGKWRMDTAQTGETNCLGDIGCHIQNAVCTLTGFEISEVLATLNVVVKGRPLDDDDVVLVRFKTGQTACFWSCQHAYGYVNDLTIRVMGDSGTAVWNVKEPTILRLYNTEDVETIIEPFEEEKEIYGRYELPETGEFEMSNIAMSNLYHSFIEDIISSKSNADYPTAEDGAESLKYIEACIKSNKLGNLWTKLE